MNLFFLDHPGLSGIFNVGTGRAQTFNDVARATINAIRRARGEREHDARRAASAAGAIEYVPFPPQLVGKYQSYTQADMGRAARGRLRRRRSSPSRRAWAATSPGACTRRRHEEES